MSSQESTALPLPPPPPTPTAATTPTTTTTSTSTAPSKSAARDANSSSEDLSLKLRRGSSNSRDSFYMEFDQGIDSDIEEVREVASVVAALHDHDMDADADIGAGEEEEVDDANDVTINGDDAVTPVVESHVTEDLQQMPGPSAVNGGVNGGVSDVNGVGSSFSDEDVDVEPAKGGSVSDAESGSHGDGGPPIDEVAHRKKVRRKKSSSWAGVHHHGREAPLSLSRPLLPSPTNPQATVVSPETLSPSQHSTPRRHLPNGIGINNGHGHVDHHHSDRGGAATVVDISPVMYQGTPPSTPTSPVLKPKKHVKSIETRTEWRREGKEALSILLSALYGKLLVVMGIAFPMSEVISKHIPSTFYEGFYVYLYFGSITYMLYVYASILREEITISSAVKNAFTRIRLASDKSDKSVTSKGQTDDTEVSLSGSECNSQMKPFTPRQFTHFGSFYLRMGAVAFGIGSMIYSGLEFGQYFELVPDTKCHNLLVALTPATRMAFTFIQMYFIFLNAKMAVYRFKTVAQFGLMHMIGTNMCVWFNVLVQETKHEILMFYDPENRTITIPQAPPASSSHNLHRRVTRGLHSIYECRRTDIMGSLVQNASPFLFPCTIEYSLICAAILYVMWKNINRFHARARRGSLSHVAPKRSPHHYSVDCTKANKGLFVGILLLVLTIIGLILFFVLINRPEYRGLAVVEVNITELILYCTTTLAVLIGMLQVRGLRFDARRNLELDNILLVVAQTGTFTYNIFTIIGGHFTIEKNTILVLVTALCSLGQALLQTIFILDASKRAVHNSDLARRKPGREVITFLLVTNLAMWAINTLEKSRADSHPIQLHFYGVWAWTIITHISMPLAIFYRFHSTVCLCEIWKRAYKIKPTYM